MSISKMAINGNSYLGIFSIATEKFALVGSNFGTKHEEILKKALEIEVAKVSINSSYLIGIYAIANSNGILVPSISDKSEVDHIKKHIHHVEVDVLDTDLTALKNNILANDKIAIINPEFSEKEAHIISDTLDVEVVRRKIAGFSTVGANNILTNKGVVFNNRIEEEEKDELENLLGMKGEQSTANVGSLNIGLCVIANSKGMVAGEQTTGFELGRISNALNYE